jgi:N-acetylglutamate synthase-like GNAT family acetyltransferase/copper chaperone CopZ
MKNLKIVPAKEEDMPFIKKYIELFRLDNENLQSKQFFLAKIEGKIVSFARIKPYKKTYELGCVGVLEKYRGKGIGKEIVKYLIDIFPQNEVYVTTDIPSYFQKLGFKVIENGPPELEEKICRVCRKKLRENVVIMVHKRKSSQEVKQLKDYKIIVEEMHCKGCENLINLTLKEIGAKSVSSDHQSGLVKATFPEEIQTELIKKKIEELGYKVKEVKS